MKSTYRYLLIIVGLCLSLSSWAEEYAFIINSENIYRDSAAQAKHEARLLYLKKKSKWSSGLDAVAYAAKDGSKEQNALITQILGMKNSEVDRYWSKRRQIDGSSAPRAVTSETVRARLVARNPGGFAVVSREYALKNLPKNTWALFYFSN